MKKLKLYVRKNLKMTTNKTAAQCVHAALGLYKQDPQTHWKCIVLELSDKKFEEAKAANPSAYVVTDAGFTEVEAGTETVMALWEEEEFEAVVSPIFTNLLRRLQKKESDPNPYDIAAMRKNSPSERKNKS